MSAAAAVRERPILFSSAMIRAILSGSKTQTRRVVTDRNSVGNFKASELRLADAWVDGVKLKAYLQPAVAEQCGEEPDGIIERLYCRYLPGDRLWVRERWAVHSWRDHMPARDGRKFNETQGHCLWSAADNACVGECDGSQRGRWRPSIHMPRWASRITLEITNVRVERVNAISEADARAEGVTPDTSLDVAPGVSDGFEHRLAFARLWDALNGPRGFGWDSNPWAWVIEFRRVTP